MTKFIGFVELKSFVGINSRLQGINKKELILNSERMN
jgi:hypothetical protein